jgi:acyl-CoA thioesterase-1
MRATLLAFIAGFLFIGCSISDSKPTENIVEKQVNSTSESSKKENVILFFGNSITAAYGLDPSEAFSAIIQRKIDSLGLNFTCVNAGNTGETTKGGLSRLDWVLKDSVAVFVLELGANDGLRGYDVAETKKNLKMIIQRFKEKYPKSKVLLAGMKVPPSMSQEYYLQFEQIYPEIAREENVALIPFILEGVAGEKDLNLPDGIHPTAEGHQILAETVWKYLYPLLK